MAYKTRQQFSIGLVYILILILLGAGAYFLFFKKTPTCSDKIQNQGEQGIDCGGPCTLSCEHLTIKDLQTDWVKFTEFKDGYYDLAAKIANPNPNFGLARFKYVFKIFDEAGNVLKEQTGSSFILPGQSEKYLIENNIFLEKKPASVKLEIEKPSFASWQKTEIPLPGLFVKNWQSEFLADRPGVFQVSGVIKNPSPYNFDVIWIYVILFDSQRDIIGLNKTQARTVLAGEERYFSVLWTAPLPGQASSVKVMTPETNILAPDNFLQIKGETEKFQEY